VGAPGTVVGVLIDALRAESVPLPDPFTARTANVYDTPFARLGTVNDRALAAIAVWVVSAALLEPR